MVASAVNKFLGLPAADRSLLLRSALLIAGARLSLWVLPFNTVRRLFERSTTRTASPPVPTPERIGWAISVAKRYVPVGNCLPQALAAASLLGRNHYPVEFRIGVVKTERGGLEAHAWVESGGRLVVGDLTQGLSTYTPLPPIPPLPSVGR